MVVVSRINVVVEGQVQVQVEECEDRQGKAIRRDLGDQLKRNETKSAGSDVPPSLSRQPSDLSHFPELLAYTAIHWGFICQTRSKFALSDLSSPPV